MAPTLGSQNIGASKLGLDTAETNPVLLRKMHRWKQSKHKQRIMEARRGAKPKAGGSNKVGVPFARSGFAKDKLPPVDSRAHRDMLDDSMGELSATLDNLQAEANSRSTPERAMQDYYEAHAPSADMPHQPQRRRQKPSGQTRQRRRAQPVPISARPEFDCTPLENRGDEVSQSGLKIRREHATREPPRKPKQARALEGISEQRVDCNDWDPAPSPSMDSSSSTSSETRPADSEDLAKAQQTIAQLRKLLHAEKEKATLRVQEAQAEARQKADQLNAALAQTKTQLRMLQKQLHKAREEATAAQQADLSLATVTRDASTAPVFSDAVAIGSTGRGFSRIRLRPRSEQRARDASTPPSRIPEPRSLRTPPVRPPVVDRVQAPAVVSHSDKANCMETDEHCAAEVDDHPVTPNAVDAALELSPPELTEVLPSDATKHSPTSSTCEPAGESSTAGQEEIEGDVEELVRLERGLSTSTSCSFCVTGSPPMATDAPGEDPPELEANELSPIELMKDADDGEGVDEGECDCQLDEAQGAGSTDVVELTDRALDGVARALGAIDATSESIRNEVEAAEIEQTAQQSSADEWWRGCGPPAVGTTLLGGEESAPQGPEMEGESDEEDMDLPVEVVTR